MKTDLFFNLAHENPAPGSLLDRYQQGEIAVHAVNWAFICGLNVAHASDLDVLAVADVEDCDLMAALDVATETTQAFPDTDNIVGYGLVIALVTRASIRLGDRGQRLQEVRQAIGGRLAWAIAAKELRRLGYQVENLPAHLRQPGAAAAGVAGPLSRRGIARAESRLGVDIRLSAKIDPGSIVTFSR